jgi:hypothetical protein
MTTPSTINGATVTIVRIGKSLVSLQSQNLVTQPASAGQMSFQINCDSKLLIANSKITIFSSTFGAKIDNVTVLADHFGAGSHQITGHVI